MSQLDAELAALRVRRTGGLMNRLRQFRPFDRRAIREPSHRDAYWANVRQRLAQSDAASLRGQREAGVPPRDDGSPESAG